MTVPRKERPPHNHSSVVWRAVAAAAAMGAYAWLVGRLELWMHLRTLYSSSGLGFKEIIGIVLGTLVVFRTNAAYGRWWEGRTLWGQIVNDARAAAGKACFLCSLDDAERRQFGDGLIALACAIRDHLRRSARLQSLRGFGDDPATPVHVPNYVFGILYARVRRWRDEGRIDGFQMRSLDEPLHALVRSLGGCERVSRTRMVPSYVRLLRMSIVLYFLTLPIMVRLDAVTIPLMLVMAFFMFGLEFTAAEIEDPFGLTEDDLRLDEICQGIENDVDEIVDTRQKGTPS